MSLPVVSTVFSILNLTVGDALQIRHIVLQQITIAAKIRAYKMLSVLAVRRQVNFISDIRTTRSSSLYYNLHPEIKLS